MNSVSKSKRALLRENAELRARLFEAHETLDAIRTGSVDALVVGDQVFTLKGADQTYRALVEAMNEGAVTLADDGMILYCNERFAEILHTPLEKVIGRSFLDFVRVGWREMFYQFLHGSGRKRMTGEVLLNAGDDREVFAHLSSNPFLLDDKCSISLVVTDITARKKAEEALQKSEERFQTVAGTVSDAIWDWDVINKTVWRSYGFYSLFRHPLDKITATYEWWVQNLHPDDRKSVLETLETFLRARHLSNRQTYRFRCGDGTYVHVEDRARALFDHRGILVRVIGTISDITEQKNAEAAKKELSKNIFDAQEQERQRVARELHDGVNQLLSSTKYRLHAIEEQLSRGDKALGKKVVQAKNLIEKAIGEVRSISRNLRPSELDDLGLAAAIRSLAAEFEDRTGITAEVKISLAKMTIPNMLELKIYRITQEALNNVEKHSGASHVSIRLAAMAEGVGLTICDNGCGFDPGNVRKTKKSGWGLANMRERASYAGGNITVKSVPKKGTEVSLYIPIN